MIPIEVINVKKVETSENRCSMLMLVYIAYTSDSPFLQYKERINSSRIRAPPNNITISKIGKYKCII